VYGEKVYTVLSLVAKSALAWQIFANTLIPDAWFATPASGRLIHVSLWAAR
jgi:hypothetical protein